MRRLILKMSMTLDGFVCGSNGEIDWLFATGDAQSKAWTLEMVRNAGVHAMGSRTFRDMAAWWPNSDDVFAAPMNEIPKAVFTRAATLDRGAGTTPAVRDAGHARDAEGGRPVAAGAATKSWDEAEVFAGDLAAGVARLKAAPGKDILAHGGAGFARSLVAQGLVDEFRLMVHPVVLGRGLPIFDGVDSWRRLALVESRSFPAGVLAQVYRPA